jgi:hypothetical protein
VLRAVHPLQQVPVDELPGEPYPHPDAGHRGGVELRRHQVVEGPVEVRQPDVDTDPGDRKLGGRLPIGAGDPPQ